MKKRFFTGFLAVSLLVSVAIIALLAFPYIANTFLLPKLIKSPKNSTVSINIFRLSPFTLNASLEVTHNGKPVINVPTITLSFSVLDLLKKECDTLRINGGTFHLRKIKENQDMKIPSLSKGSIAGKKNTDVEKFLSNLPFKINTIECYGCNIFVHHQQRSQDVISFNSIITVNYAKDIFKNLNLNIKTSGDLVAEASLEFENNPEQYSLTFQGTQSGVPLFLQPLLPESLNIEYNIFSSNLNVHFEKKNFEIARIKGNIDAKDLSIKGSNYSFGFSDQVRLVTFAGDSNNLDYEITNLFFRRPLPFQFKSRGKVAFSDIIAGSGVYQIIDNSGKTQTNDIINGSYTFQKNKHRIFSANMALDATKPMTFNFKDQDIEISSISSTLTVEKNEEKFKGEAKTVISEIIFPEQQIRFEALSFQLPITLEVENNTFFPAGKGSMKINKVIHNNNHVATLNSDFTYSSKEAQLSALVTTPLQDDLVLKVTGYSDYTKHNISLTMPEIHLNSETFTPYLEFSNKFEFDGKFSTRAVIASNSNSNTATITLKEANVSFPENDIFLNNINTQLHISDLVSLRSKPSQQLTAERIDLGTLRFKDVGIIYRLEGKDNIFIEKSQLSWCDGKVESGSISLAKKDLKTTLYCDRINFAQLLSQFGIEGVNGTGSLNGKIPIHFSKMGVFFDNGFLYSTPGESSTMHFSNTEILQSAMPTTKQTATLEYSLMALKSFSYDWSRLTFTSQDEELTLNMALQGKPSEPLPFRYQYGNIVNDTKGPGIQHPLRLDLNFNLPQENIFKLGKKLQTIKENL